MRIIEDGRGQPGVGRFGPVPGMGKINGNDGLNAAEPDECLNFPKGHPARDAYDTFMTEETDANGDRLIAPAHTSTMQNRVLKKYHGNLRNSEAIAAIVPDRVFRNEDLDARHEHTFYQVEGVYVAKGVNVGNLIATLQEFLQEYYGKKLDVRVNPFYFPFTGLAITEDGELMVDQQVVHNMKVHALRVARTGHGKDFLCVPGALPVGRRSRGSGGGACRARGALRRGRTDADRGLR